MSRVTVIGALTASLRAANESSAPTPPAVLAAERRLGNPCAPRLGRLVALESPHLGFLGSALSVKLASLVVAAFGITLGATVTDIGPSEQEHDAFVCETARDWRARHGGDRDLRVIRVDVGFRGHSGAFRRTEGTVAAPVGVEVPGVQTILATAAFPAPLMTAVIDDVRTHIWAYPGSVHREMRFTALSLVRNAGRAAVPSRDERIADELAAYEASVRVSSRDTHALANCAGFVPWVNERFGQSADAAAAALAIVGEVAGSVDPARHSGDKLNRDNVCSAIRERRFTPHQAHVAAVAAIREKGVPAFAVSSAEHGRRHLIAVRTGPLRWRIVDVLDAARRFLDVPPPLLARADGLRTFQRADHEHWNARAGIYAPGGSTLARTKWAHEPWDAPRFTRVKWHALDEVCP